MMSRPLTIGFSPCPNDTFIFDALVNKKIDSAGLLFEPVLEDVETLNQWAIEGKLDITKLSFPALFLSMDNYALLNAGSALGKGVGPLLISKHDPASAGPNSTIAIPGINTTANLLLSFAFPKATKKIPMIFSVIEDAVLDEKTELGVIIHENRFTYRQRGLHKVLDLGEYWEEKTQMPIPLGGIAVKRVIDKPTSMQVETLIRKSLEYAFANYPSLPDYVKEHSQAMKENVMRQHIDLYVNNFSLDLGLPGREAIEKLFEVFNSLHKQPVSSLSSSQLFLS